MNIKDKFFNKSFKEEKLIKSQFYENIAKEALEGVKFLQGLKWKCTFHGIKSHIY